MVNISVSSPHHGRLRHETCGFPLCSTHFPEKYGQELPNGTYEISASWQAGLSNGASVGSLMGLLLNGYLSERFGFRNTMLASLAFITATIFIPFFAPSIEVLLVGQVLMGIPWGIFQTLTTSYAAEVAPTHLRAYLTTYVNLCWVKLTPSAHFLSFGW
jgi:Arabinose efflux permease